MSGATVVEFLAYWKKEGESYVRRGDYEWMAAQAVSYTHLLKALALATPTGFGRVGRPACCPNC